MFFLGSHSPSVLLILGPLFTLVPFLAGDPEQAPIYPKQRHSTQREPPHPLQSPVDSTHQDEKLYMENGDIQDPSTVGTEHEFLKKKQENEEFEMENLQTRNPKEIENSYTERQTTTNIKESKQSHSNLQRCSQTEKCSGSTNSITSNADVTTSKQRRIKQIKEQILKQIGLSAAPNMTGVVISESPVLQRIIKETNLENQRNGQFLSPEDLAEDDPKIKIDKMFLIASEQDPTRVNIPDGHRLLFFNLSQEHASGITMATLHFWLKPTKNTSPKHTAAKITILNVEPSKYPHDYNRLRTIIDDITVPYSPHGIWANVDVFRLVTQWIPNFEDNLGFVVKVSTVDGVMLDIDTVEDDPYHAPLLELDVRKEHNDRSKRFANKRICSDQKIERDCCRYPLIVNFLKYKFDFIVAPKKYMANYCTGECPFLYAHKIPHISVVQQLFPANSTKSNHGPCCGARDLSPLKMLYYDGRTIKLDVINDMVVNQCSCT